MAENKSLVKSKVEDVRTFLMRDAVKDQIKLALPKHLSADRLLRVAFTSILRTPGLLECTRESLLSCIMTCAQLGLEPDQFLGQAYLIPFKNAKKGVKECQLMPGYRGYIALARRTGEVQSVSSQVVYSKDKFILQYGLEEKLDHQPAEGDRGVPKGVYVVFHYKDGSQSFDYMSLSDVERIRKRSKTPQDGPWVTDWDEMAKKTVIKRHVKLAPMSVEFAHAVALEDRGLAGVTQADLLYGGEEEETPEMHVAGEVSAEQKELALQSFTNSIPKETDPKDLEKFLTLTAQANRSTVDQVKVEASANTTSFWYAYLLWVKKQKNGKGEKMESAKPEKQKEAVPCPEDPTGKTQKFISFCNEKCSSREGCPAFSAQ